MNIEHPQHRIMNSMKYYEMFVSAEILGVVEYWWGLDDVLRKAGAEVYTTSVNGMDSTAAKAADFKRQYLEILAISGKPKANIIGQSHGAVYTRYAISNLGLGDMVASHTSIAGPHRGRAIADTIVGIIPDSMEWLVGDMIDVIYDFFGDTDPDSLQNAYDITRTNMIDNFNPNTPDVTGVYYQSWTGIINRMSRNPRNWYLGAFWPILTEYEDENDGLVSVSSAKWGTFRGVEKGGLV
jgi:triacylglycerol lipase